MDPRLVTQPSLITKPTLHCLGIHVVIPVGGSQGISLLLLFQSKLSIRKKKKKNNVTSQITQEQQLQENGIKAQTLLTRAQEITKNCKKALACVMSKHSPYKDYARTRNLPSGMVHDDYNLQYVREKTYVVLNPDETTTAAAFDNSENTTYPIPDSTGASTNLVDTIERTGLLTPTTCRRKIKEQPAMSDSFVSSSTAKLFSFPAAVNCFCIGGANRQK